MKIVGCDPHARQQSIAMVDTESGELTEKRVLHEGNGVGEFYASLEGPVVVGIEATGTMQWFLELVEELGIECRVGHPAKIRAAETRKQKHDRRDAEVILDLLRMKDRFPDILDTVHRTKRPANLVTGSRPMGEDANAIAAHTPGHSHSIMPGEKARRCGLRRGGEACRI